MMVASQRTLMRGMIGVAVAALLALAALSTTAHVKSTALLQAKQDKMDQYIAGAERQLSVLSRSLPVGKVAAKYPKEENELKQLFVHSEKGLQALAVAEAQKKQAEKKQVKSSKLAQQKDLHKLVNEAGRMMTNLEAQLPPADKKAFPKEAGELNAAFSSELKHLKGIDQQLTKEQKKTATTTLAAAAKQKHFSMAAQAALDHDVEADREENKALSQPEDVDHMMDTLNAPAVPSPKGKLVKKAPEQAARPQALAMKPKGKKAKKHAKQPRGDNVAEAAGALTPSGIQRWGTVYQPNLGAAMGGGMRGQSQMYAPAQKEYAGYEDTVSKWMNVKDPAAPTPHGTNWWADKSKHNDAWWSHNHNGRGY